MKDFGDINSILDNSKERITRFTPRQLIKFHIEHPEIPITDNDIENLILEIPVVNRLRNKISYQ